MTFENALIEVAVALGVHNTFTYRIPEAFAPLVSAGQRVLVPFGARRATGYVLGPAAGTGAGDIKLILDVLDAQPLFPSAMIPFFRWVAGYYIHPLGQVIKTALPGGLTFYDTAVVSITDRGAAALAAGSATVLEAAILARLKTGPCRVRDLGEKLGQDVPRALLQSLQQRGFISRRMQLRGGGTRLRTERYVVPAAGAAIPPDLSEPRSKILAVLKDRGQVSVKDLKKQVPTAPALIRSMVKAGQISIRHKAIYRDPFGESIGPDRMPVLNDEQQQVVSRISTLLDRGFKTILLQGVTGSGKTEVYMQLAAEAIKHGHCALVLVPEIALITQTERRFRARFGDNVAVLHSALSAGERFDQWRRILDNRARIAVGARSAVFAPFDNLGIIIVDEEHDTSYKQESTLRYNARDLAVVRAKLQGCVALLGSATPSVQSYHNVTTKKFVSQRLHQRIEQRPLPEIKVVDLRASRDARGIRRFITPELHEAMAQTLARGEQSLLFLNRRGYASFPVCASCGQAIRCKNCDITLTLHKKTNAYRCHYCGYTRPSTSSCTVCGSDKIKRLGMGTERIEEAVKALFPTARVARMDRDTTRRKGSVLTVLKDLKNGAIDVLVGTQMVAKGHDFPNITLVGIICADLSLSFPDFRAGERTFQLLAQVSGRAGRGDAPGRVILQTYNPEHFSILAAKRQDFEAFYSHEIHYRRALDYPPFSKMVQLKIAGRDQKKTEIHARTLGEFCQGLKKDHRAGCQAVDIMGPIEASLTRIAGHYRWQILLKGRNAGVLHRFVGRLLADHPASFNHRQVKVAIDVDPFYLM